MVVCVVIDCVCRFSCGSFYGICPSSPWFVLTFVVACAALFRIPGVLGYCDNRTVASSFRIHECQNQMWIDTCWMVCLHNAMTRFSPVEAPFANLMTRCFFHASDNNHIYTKIGSTDVSSMLFHSSSILRQFAFVGLFF